MDYATFLDVKKEMWKFQDRGYYSEALEVLLAGIETLPKEVVEANMADILLRKMLMYKECGMAKEFINTMAQYLGRGYFCWPSLLETPLLQNDERYQEFTEVNASLRAKAQKEARMSYMVRVPHNYKSDQRYPLMFLLHGGGEWADEFQKLCPPDTLLEKGFIVAYVQSSQVSWTMGYSWNDPITARKDIEQAYQQISAEYSIDPERVIIGGFCGGAIATLDIVMVNLLPFRGFIAFSPDEKPESFTKENVQLAKDRGLKGTFTEGELFMPVPDEEEMMKIFDEVGFTYKFHINKGIGLTLPAHVGEQLGEAVEFILG